MRSIESRFIIVSIFFSLSLFFFFFLFRFASLCVEQLRNVTGLGRKGVKVFFHYQLPYVIS